MKGRVPAGNIKLKRAYEASAPEDGMRILVDRLWPRGLSKQRAAIEYRTSRRAPNSASGLAMIPAVGMNSAAAMPKRCTNTPSFWINCGRSRGKVRSPWCIQPVMRCTTMPSN